MRKTRQLLLTVAVIALALVRVGDSLSAQGTPCGMMLNNSQVVFCETFDQPFPVTTRSGQLDGTLWGVSRAAVGGAWNTSVIDACDGQHTVNPPNDVIVCNGQMRESIEDNGSVYVLAAYPKQPFDWANRTGTVSFDVTNDTSGSHGTWPEFWISDLPVPAPFIHGNNPCVDCSVPKHALGIRLDAEGGSCPGGWRATSVIAVRNYVIEEKGIFDPDTGGMRIQQNGCASEPSGPNGGMNHVEFRISQNTIEVWSTDAGTRSGLHKINTITNANLSFTRGLIWIEDAHYNAHKSDRPDTHNHTFAWDNVAFDGPVTYRDLSFDVLDKGGPGGMPGTVQLGWQTSPSAPASLTTLPMTAANISAATRALLLFNFGWVTQVDTINYSINGHAVSVPNPVGLPLRGLRSVSFEVPLSWLVPGAQQILLSANTPDAVENVNIVLVAAATVPPVAGVTPPATPKNLRIIL